MPQRAADAHTGKSCNVQSSDCLQYREGINMPQVIGFQCGADNLLLTSQSLVRKSRTSAGDFLCFALQKAAVTALLVVVLPIPISPVARSP